MNITKLISFYQDWLGFKNYYSIIINSQKIYESEFIQNYNFLNRIKSTTDSTIKELHTKKDDLRIDVPVWFGNIERSHRKVLVYGLEPRDTNSKFNVERIQNRVFGTPFGIDRWNSNSNVKGKPQNKYFRVFNDVIDQNDTFILFSDIVKFYKIIDPNNKNKVNDKYARNNFIKHANESLLMLKKEIEIVNPTHIITLGNNSFRFIKNLLPDFQNIITGIRHPANGGERIAKEQLNQLFNKN